MGGSRWGDNSPDSPPWFYGFRNYKTNKKLSLSKELILQDKPLLGTSDNILRTNHDFWTLHPHRRRPPWNHKFDIWDGGHVSSSPTFNFVYFFLFANLKLYSEAQILPQLPVFILPCGVIFVNPFVTEWLPNSKQTSDRGHIYFTAITPC